MPKIILYADGSSLGNPGPGGWGVVALLPGGTVRELGGGVPHTTNNRMELTAAIEGLNAFLKEGPVEVRTDSSYVINGATKWLKGWERNGWITSAKKPVENREFWEALSALLKEGEVTFKYVPGHQGVEGNERADAIARGFAGKETIHLYQGPLSIYSVDLAKPMGPLVKKKSGPAYSYLSMVKGVIEKHRTWAECEARVRGVPGARFRKAHSPEDEASVIKEWKR
ncbi:ribonuclease HI [Candidatus Parcubacteria bacterium]|nr:ribonuclease HI [Candidatus Parcubacteria bacterium]